MKWSEASRLSDSQFKRLMGIKRETFSKMLETILLHRAKRKTKRGRPGGIQEEDKLLMMLMYHREYRTYFHIATTFGISEAQCWKVVHKVEDILIKSELFHLPGKKQLLDGSKWEAVVVDVAESPIERPKKNSGGTIRAKRNGIR